MNPVEFKSVSKAFGGTPVLDRMSLAVERAERVVLFGDSGCGKTTVLRLIAGLAVPDSGSVLIKGAVVAESGRVLLEPEKRGIGMVFQDLALWPHMTVQQNLEFGLQARGIGGSERDVLVRQALALVRLEGRAAARPGDLSGGEQQRVALARALVIRPSILLMDEPLSSLDRKSKEQMIREIVRLHEELQFTLLYVTHDRDEMSAIATRVVHMSHED